MNTIISSSKLSAEYVRVSGIAGLKHPSESSQDDHDFYNMYDGCAFE